MRRMLQDRFCPKCGRPSDTEGLCNPCRAGDTPWITCDPRVTGIHCPACGATKRVNTWTDTHVDRTGLARELAGSAVHLHPDLKKPKITIHVEDTGPTRSRAEITVKGTLYTIPVEKDCTTEIIWQKEQCDRCNRISGSYYEGTVQVRAEGRHVSPFEVQTAFSVATQIEDSLQAGGERLSFISDMAETRDGLDITVGSQHIGLMIAQGITAQLGGRYTTHPKLVGEKDGRQLYRITYSVRLSRFQKQDVVRLNDTYAEVEQVEGRRIRIFDLDEGRSRSVPEDAIVQLVGNSRNAEPALVAYVSGDMAGILDPASGASAEYRKPPWLDVNAGMYVRVLRDGNHLVIVR
jgi:nonsense-mediated mRNA decay protein 3